MASRKQAAVAAPTYMADIRFFFRDVDIEHMKAHGVDLSTYEGVKANATSIYLHTAPPHPNMPPDPAGQWSAERVQTFKTWIMNGCPQGAATVTASKRSLAAIAPTRVRKNVATLSADEVDRLRTAFSGLMARDKDPTRTDSYFALAGIHGLPQTHCLHHEDRYNPWHRTYLRAFEDQLRTIEGCEDVTIPYWDISTPMPALLTQPPFATYVLPRDPRIGASPPNAGPYFPYKTQRYTPKQFAQNLAANDVLGDLSTALTESRWGASDISGYQNLSIQAHDGGHLSIGPTMADQSVASYDPVFWFYHCNLDRNWLSWQTLVGGTTLSGFKSTLDSTDWLEVPFNALPPFTTTADATIAVDYGYDQLSAAPAEGLRNTMGSVRASSAFSVKRSSPVSVRVKDIDRLAIPGSFTVHLLADGKPIAQRGFFQPSAPRDCAGCAKHGLVNVDFRIDHEKLLDRTLSVRIEVPGLEKSGGTRFPLAQAGNPTINARLLLEDE